MGLYWYELDLERDYIARENGYEDYEDYLLSDTELEARLELWKVLNVHRLNTKAN